MGGFPCKSVSPLSTTPGSVNDNICTSSIGWLGMKSYIKKHRPSMVLIENVSRLFSQRKVEGGTSSHPGLILRSVVLNQDHKERDEIGIFPQSCFPNCSIAEV